MERILKKSCKKLYVEVFFVTFASQFREVVNNDNRLLQQSV